MIDMVQPTLFIIILVIVVHQSVQLASADFCPPKTSSCAKGVRIINPFWIADSRSLGEGCTNYPGFEVKCGIDGTPFINISNNHYTVLRINLGYITVREAAINGQECPQPQLNFSTGSTQFLTLQSPENNMTIFYNCSSPPPDIEAKEIPCLKKYYNNSTKHSYAFHGDQIPIGFDWYRSCEKSVLTYVQGDLFSNVEELRRGFYLDYKLPVNCTDCVLSGGQCSSNETTGAITCLCPGDIKMIVDVCPSKVSTGFCRTNTSCANGVKIDEPFWIGDGSPGEGCTNYPGFRVKCSSDGTPVINISNGLYTVLSLYKFESYYDSVYYNSYGNNEPSGIIRVRKADINGQECPQPQQNFSIGSTRFLSMGDSDKMRIFYNCSSPPPNIEAQEIRCLEKHNNNSTKHSYGLPDAHIPEGFDWYGNCAKNVLAYTYPYTDLVEALRSGFSLSWTTPVDCTDCELSGGKCSANETTGVITCHCPGDVKKIDEVCPKMVAGFCRTKTSCGNRVRIDEPFWIGDASPGVGCTNYPEFRVECANDGTPVMNISNALYTVLSISTGDYLTDNYQRSGTVIVRESDINDQICPQPQQNLSISSIWFLSGYSRPNMRIFYNCSSPPPSIEVQEIRCLEKYYNNSAKHSYGFSDAQIPEGFDWYGNCEKNVLTYTYPYTDLVEALRSGFGLYWKTPLHCTDCERSGGQCSSNKTTGGFTCDCPFGYGQRINEICERSGYHDIPTVTLSVKRRILIGVSAGVGSSILIFILLCIFRKRIYNSIVSYWRKKIKNLSNVEVFLENYGYLAIQRYKYSDIKKLTNSFKETLGQGGYGSVFKGKLHDGRLVAVKVLNEAKGKGEDFINEVAAIGKTNHVNVVSLLGFCTEKNKRALVYEYMPNGSLERFIYNEKNSNATSRLGGDKLYEIALGIARGLEYLHRGCNTRILHLDIKPHNILLDQDFCPRISDFGLAKLCPTKESLVSMVGARGTIGYIAPEICCRNFGGVSHKSDVYSYGMMVLEMIGGRKNIDATVENMSEIYFPQWVYTRLEQYYTKEGIEDTNVQVLGEFFKEEKTKKMIKVALWCIQPHPGDRPSMSKVVEMLEGKSIELQMPPNPFPDPSSVTSTSS